MRREVLCIVPIQCGTTLHQVSLIKMCLIEIYSTLLKWGSIVGTVSRLWDEHFGFQCLVGRHIVVSSPEPSGQLWILSSLLCSCASE